MNHRNRINKAIQNNLKDGTKFVIYPFGYYGKMTKQILNWDYGVEEAFIIDNNLCKYNKAIKRVEDLDGRDCSQLIFLLVSGNESVYADIRQGLSKYVADERIIDVFSISPLINPDEYFSPPNLKMQRCVSLEICAREIYRNNVPGAVAEAGVYKGYTASILNRLFCDRKLYLFDTFEGFDRQDIEYDLEHGFNLSNEYNCNAVHILKDTDEKLVMSKMPFPNNISIRKGYWPDTAIGLEECFCFVNLDMDLYKPQLAALRYFAPRMYGNVK